MSALNWRPTGDFVSAERRPQTQRLRSHVTEDKLYWVYLAPDEVRQEHCGLSDRVAIVRRLLQPEPAEPCSPRESWIMTEPSSHARFPSDSLRAFQAGSSV